MATKTFNLKIDPVSVRAIKQSIESYRDKIDDKFRTIIRRLYIEEGLPEIDARYNRASMVWDHSHTSGITIAPTSRGVRATIWLQGDQVAFIEFGAGVHYNGAVGSSPHPRGTALGMTIGSFGPKGALDYWWYNGMEWFGTKAEMPLYGAQKKMVDECLRICREEFA